LIASIDLYFTVTLLLPISTTVWAKLNDTDTTLHFNHIEQRYFKQQKTSKTGGRV